MSRNTSTLEWRKVRVAESTRKQMEFAVQRLNESGEDRFRLITRLFGKQLVCEIGDITLFSVGTGTRPSNIIPVAISAESPSWVAFPLNSVEDFADLCQRLGREDELSRNELKQFLTPRSRKR